MNTDEIKKKNKLNLSLDKTAIIQLIMILIIIIVYCVFLYVQQFLFSFEGFRNKIIIINILLALGLIIEIGHFFWVQYKKRQKSLDNVSSKQEDMDKKGEEE